MNAHDTAPVNAQGERKRRTCDIVMKGGITSGVVYPQAITTLAARFDFKNIGGTSAGAIAAAIAAAAEYRRQCKGSSEGFAFLGRLPSLLGEKTGAGGSTRLFNFFQPVRETKRIFAVVTGALGGDAGGLPAKLRVLTEQYPGCTLAGMLPGLLLVIASAAHLESGWVAWLWIFLGAVSMPLLGIACALAAFALDFIREVPRNGYGLCSGVRDASRAGAAQNTEPLTEWLAAYLDETAGLDASGKPLTFCDLWGHSESDQEKAPRRINLEMMTTNISHGRPYRMPFRDDADLHENQLFYFQPDEFRRLFPERIVQWMIDHPRDDDGSAERIARRVRLLAQGYHPLPAPADMPVIVPTRMSLSFPILLSAVPLHAIDRSAFHRNEQPERCWFSDGGMCSNFPLHFFDTALPRRPTFSIDLEEKPSSTPPDKLVPEMDVSNGGEISDRWNRFDTGTPERAGELPADKPDVQRLLGFFSAMIGTMQNWTDATQGRLPGYRDRIVRVPLTPDEGGLNLDMPPERIAALTQRGVQAAELLMKHFDVPSGEKTMTWDNHRWVRLRSFLASLEKSLMQLVNACEHPENGDRGYEQWLADVSGREGEKAPSYEMSGKQIGAARETLRALREIEILWHEAPAAHRAPRPRPVLRPRAQI